MRDILLSTVRTSLLRLVAFLGGIIFTVAVSRLLSVDEAGKFFVFLTTFKLISVLTRFGAERAIIKLVANGESVKDNSTSFLASIKYIALRSIFMMIIISLILIIYYLFIVPEGFENFAISLVWLIGIFPYNFTITFSGFCKGMGMASSSTFFENSFTSLISFLALVVLYVAGLKISLLQLSIVYVLSSIIQSGLGYYLYRSKTSFSIALDYVLTDTEKSYFASMGRISLFGNISLLVPTIFVGLFVSSTDAAVYNIAYQLAGTLGIITMVVTSVFAAKFAQSFHSDLKRQLLNLLHYALWMSTGGAIGVALMIILGEPIIAFVFGYDIPSTLIHILLAASILNVSVGPMYSLFAMCGQEKVNERIVLLLGMLGIILYGVASVIGQVELFAIVTLLLMLVQGIIVYIAYVRFKHTTLLNV